MDASATTQVSALRRADLRTLQAEYERLFSKKTSSRNREWLFKVVAKKIQGDDEPESSKRPVPLAQLVAKYSKTGRSKNKSKTAKREKSTEPKKSKSRVKPVGGRDPRLPQKNGTIIERIYKGKKLHVTVEADGFTFSGKSYKSLSALAQHITGAKAINGYLFFQLGDYAKPVRRGAKEKAGK
jgi:hypothetical protein